MVAAYQVHQHSTRDVPACTGKHAACGSRQLCTNVSLSSRQPLGTSFCEARNLPPLASLKYTLMRSNCKSLSPCVRRIPQNSLCAYVLEASAARHVKPRCLLRISFRRSLTWYDPTGSTPCSSHVTCITQPFCQVQQCDARYFDPAGIYLSMHTWLHFKRLAASAGIPSLPKGLILPVHTRRKPNAWLRPGWRTSQNLAPIWFPHCPAWMCTISRMVAGSLTGAASHRV